MRLKSHPQCEVCQNRIKGRKALIARRKRMNLCILCGGAKEGKIKRNMCNYCADLSATARASQRFRKWKKENWLDK